jgi:hypothetical protein
MPNLTVRASAEAMPISQFIRDPVVGAGLGRAPPAGGAGGPGPTPKPRPVLTGGAAESREMAHAV